LNELLLRLDRPAGALRHSQSCVVVPMA